MRKGKVLSDTTIDWSIEPIDDQYYSYRAASVTSRLINTPESVYWIGGAKDTYNYNGRSYLTNNFVEPAHSVIWISPYTKFLGKYTDPRIPMDLRGVGVIWGRFWYVAGGMQANGRVTNSLLQLSINTISI